MGLDITPGGARWSYSGFGDFRKELWNLAGFKGDLYELYYGKKHETAMNRRHDLAKEHPLFPLFNHSDCDGSFSIDECIDMLPDLYTLCPQLKNGYDRFQCAKLISGMEECVERKIKMEFR